MSLPFESAAAIAAAVRSGATSAADVCRAALDTIARTDGAINAFRTVAREQAIAQAEALDRRPDTWA